MDANQVAKDLMIKTQHIREVTDALVSKLPSHQIKEVEVSLAIKPDFVPDLTKMLGNKDTMVMSYTICLMPRPGTPNKVIEQHRAYIRTIHSRHAMVADKLADGSFPVVFVDTLLTDLESTEYFKQYSEEDDATEANWASKKAANDIWEFLFRGTIPI